MNGTSVSQATVIGNVPNSFTLAGVADLNNDGKGDLLWYDTSGGTLSAWFMNGTSVSGTAILGSVPPTTWSIVGETNGYILWRDTSGDIALWGVQNGQVTTSNGLATVTSNFLVQGLGDFNGDGFPDILWRDTNTGVISIWFTNGQTVASAGVVSTLPSNWNVVQVGDYDGNGTSDLLLMDTAGDVAMWLMSSATVSQSFGVANLGTGWTVQNVNAN
jgi:FG-GAP-like repeat